MSDRQYAVYILTNKTRTVLYTGVTNDLKRRMYEHKTKAADGFTKKYNVNLLIYSETTVDPMDAIAREKQLKAGSRKRKEDLIHASNPEWVDLTDQL